MTGAQHEQSRDLGVGGVPAQCAAQRGVIHRVGGAGQSAVANRYFPGMHRRWRVAAAVSTCVLVGALASGCTGEAEADPTVRPSTETTQTRAVTPSAMPTNGSTPPARPDAMSSPSAQGAAAAASYFFGLYPHVYGTGDLSEWAALSAPGCSFCEGISADVQEMVAANEVEVSGAVEIAEAKGTEIRAGEWYSAHLVVVQGPSERRAADGTVLSSGAGGTFDVVVALSWIGAWRVDQVDVAPRTS